MHKPLILSGDAEAAGGQPAPRPEAEQQHPWVRHGAVYSRVLDYDPLYNRTTTYFYDTAEKKEWHTETWHDISPLIEANKAQYNSTDENARWTPLRDGGEMGWRKTATVPLAIALEVLKKTHNGKDRAAVSRWHMDPENRHFLVRPIKVGV